MKPTGSLSQKYYHTYVPHAFQVVTCKKNFSGPSIGNERKFMTSYQEILKKEFENNPFPKTEEQHQLAKSLNVSVNRIRSWYARRRFSKREAGFPIKGENTLTKGTRTHTQIHTSKHS